MIETLFDIEIVKSNDGDMSEEGVELFNVEFSLNSLKQYNGKSILITQNWDISIYDDNGDVVTFNIIENEEFKTLLKSKYYQNQL